MTLDSVYFFFMPVCSGTPARLLHQDAVWSCTGAALTSLQPSHHGQHTALLRGEALGTPPQKAVPYN